MSTSEWLESLLRFESLLRKEDREVRFGIEKEGLIGLEGGIPVTCLQNVAMARKQNFAGVVKENKTGKTCAVSMVLLEKVQNIDKSHSPS